MRSVFDTGPDQKHVYTFYIVVEILTYETPQKM